MPSGGLGAALGDQRGAPEAYRKVAETAADPLPLANAGGGLLLGAFTYVLGLTYLRSGGPGVRALLAAKFLNKTSGGGGGGSFGGASTPSTTRSTTRGTST